MAVSLTSTERFPLILKGGKTVHMVPHQPQEVAVTDLLGVTTNLMRRGVLTVHTEDGAKMTVDEVEVARSA